MGIENSVLSRFEVSGLPLLRRGKVRDVYDLGERLLIVSTDRLSAFDWVLPTMIPDKGRILNQVSVYWFKATQTLVPNHFLTEDIRAIRKEIPETVKADWEALEGRTMLVKKARRADAECIARGYLAGSGFKEYKARGTVCGQKLPPGLKEASKLPEPIFTPSTKAEEGHDQNISFEALIQLVGQSAADGLKDATLKLYRFAAERLKARGLILADTKFEFGFSEDRLIAIDEMLTPDSSRIWDAERYKEGVSPESFDKQFVRDYLEKTPWDKNSAPPDLPADIVEQTRRRYLSFLDRLKK